MATKSNPWPKSERDIMFRVYPSEGYKGVQALLPHRTRTQIGNFARMNSISVTRAVQPEKLTRRLRKAEALPRRGFSLPIRRDASLPDGRICVVREGKVIASPR